MATLPRCRPALALLLLLAGAGVSVLGSPQKEKPGTNPPKVEDDADDRAYERAMAQRLVRESCLMCHSDELIATQRLTAKQWKAEVEKMVGWGAPLGACSTEIATA